MYLHADDPMSIISLITQKGRLPTRPTIIQLSDPLDGQSPTVGDSEAQTALGPVDNGLASPARSPARRVSEVLLIPGPKGPELVFSRELMHIQQQPQQSPQPPAARFFISPTKVMRETGVGEFEHTQFPS